MHALQGEDNVGIAMTFSIVSHLRELLLQLVSSRLERRIQEEKEKERRELEVGIVEVWSSIYTYNWNRKRLRRQEAHP